MGLASITLSRMGTAFDRYLADMQPFNFKTIPAALALVGAVALSSPGYAQAPATVKLCVQNGTTCTPVNPSNPLPVDATVSASVGGFQPSASGARGTPLTVTIADSTGTLPTGAVIVVSNVGTTNPMYCNVNNIAATAADQLIGPNSWFGFTRPSGITTLRCIATGGSTTANMVGGDGLPTGAGGGSAGGGSGGSVTQGTDPWLVAGKGTAGTPAGGVVTVQGVTSMTPLAVSQATASNLNAAVVGTGTAGTPAGNILTVQGVASMTPFLANPGTAANWGLGATGAAVPANAQYMGIISGGNLTGWTGAVSQTGTWVNNVLSQTAPVSTMNSASANSGVNSAVAMVFDDVTPTAITENNFGFARMSANRVPYSTIRDGASGAERGAGVNASNQLAIAGPITVVSGGIASGGLASGSMVDLLTIIGSKSGGTGAASSMLAGGVYNTSAPTLTNGQQAALQFDVNGNLKITGGSAGGTSLADEGTFTQGTTNTTPAGCLFTSSVVNLTTGQAGAVRCTNDRMMLVSDPLLLAAAQAGTATNGSAPSTSSIGVGGNGSGATGGLQRLQIICDQHAFFDSTTQLTTLVAGVSGRKVYICGYIVSTGATATNIGLTSGTGTNCASTSVAITPVYKLLANDSRGANSPTWNGLITLANGDNLCQSASAANDHQVEVWYAIL